MPHIQQPQRRRRKTNHHYYVRLTCPHLKRGTVQTMLRMAPRLLTQTARRRQELTGLLLHTPEGHIRMWERTDATATESMGCFFSLSSSCMHDNENTHMAPTSVAPHCGDKSRPKGTVLAEFHTHPSLLPDADIATGLFFAGCKPQKKHRSRRRRPRICTSCYCPAARVNTTNCLWCPPKGCMRAKSGMRMCVHASCPTCVRISQPSSTTTPPSPPFFCKNPICVACSRCENTPHRASTV